MISNNYCLGLLKEWSCQLYKNTLWLSTWLSAIEQWPFHYCCLFTCWICSENSKYAPELAQPSRFDSLVLRRSSLAHWFFTNGPLLPYVTLLVAVKEAETWGLLLTHWLTKHNLFNNNIVRFKAIRQYLTLYFQFWRLPIFQRIKNIKPICM